MRSVSALARQAMYVQETGEEPVILLTINHESFTQPLRCVSFVRDVVSRGNTFKAYPFEFQLPDDRDDQVTSARLSIDNIGEIELEDGTKTTMTAMIRQIQTAPEVTVEIVLASTPDVVEAGPYWFMLRDITYDAMTISGEMAWEDVLNQEFPGDTFTPATAPGLFQ